MLIDRQKYNNHKQERFLIKVPEHLNNSIMRILTNSLLVLAASSILLIGCKSMTKTQKGAAIGVAGGAAMGAIIGKAAGKVLDGLDVFLAKSHEHGGVEARHTPNAVGQLF